MSLKETIYAFSVPCFAIMLFVPIPLFLASIPLGLLAIALVFDHQHRQIDSADWSVFFLVLCFIAAVFNSSDILKSAHAFSLICSGLIIYFFFRSGIKSSLAYLPIFSGLLSIFVTSRIFIALSNNGERNPQAAIERLSCSGLVVPNDFFFFILIMPFTFLLIYSDRRNSERLIGIVSVLMTLAVAYLLESRLCILGGVIASLFFLFFKNPRWVIPASGALVLGFLSIDLANDFAMSKKFYLLVEHNTRVGIWWVATKSFLTAPILGNGPATFSSEYMEHLPLLQAQSWAAVDDRVITWAHNLFFEALSERGSLGFLSLALLMLNSLRLGFKNRRTNSGLALLCCLTLFWLGSLFEFTLSRVWVAPTLLFFAALVCLENQDSAGGRQPRKA